MHTGSVALNIPERIVQWYIFLPERRLASTVDTCHPTPYLSIPTRLSVSNPFVDTSVWTNSLIFTRLLPGFAILITTSNCRASVSFDLFF